MGLIIGPSKSHSSFASYIGNVALGSTYQCGRLICKNGGIAWIVAPSCSQVSRTWHLRNDAVTTALACTAGATGWFVPTVSQLQNPGYTCRTFWDSFSSTNYWSSTEFSATVACRVYFNTGFTACNLKTNTYCVRAFRCVTY
jgi:hypothetical protein